MKLGKSFEVTSQAIDLITEKGAACSMAPAFETFHDEHEVADHHNVEDWIDISGRRGRRKDHQAGRAN
jgi:hypothetical protein